MPVSEPGGPFALALSARSDVFQEFDGGPGQIAIDGRVASAALSARPSPTAVCVRPPRPSHGWRPDRARSTR
jgi:hypothetical protein